jgi:hypothetical protein
MGVFPALFWLKWELSCVGGLKPPNYINFQNYILHLLYFKLEVIVSVEEGDGLD